MGAAAAGVATDGEAATGAQGTSMGGGSSSPQLSTSMGPVSVLVRVVWSGLGWVVPVVEVDVPASVFHSQSHTSGGKFIQSFFVRDPMGPTMP